MVRYETKEELHQAIEQRIGHSIPNGIWEKVQPDWYEPYDETDLKEILEQLKPGKILIEPQPSQKFRKGHSESRTSKALHKVFEHAKAESKNRTLEEAHYVASVRKQLFGSESPPCQDLDEMRQWIRRQAEIDGPATVHTEERSVTLSDGQIIPASSWVDTLDWPGEDNWIECVPVAEDKTLGKLRQAAKSLAGRIDCEPAAAVAHVLTGKIPLVTPIRYTLNMGTRGPSITLKVNYSWVPAEIVRSTYIDALKDARERWKIIKEKRARSSPITAKIITFLAEHKDENWWDVWKLWNQQNPQHKYSHPRYLYRTKH